MIKKAFVLMLIVGGVVNAQIWVEDYNYTDSELSSSKWTPTNILGSPTFTFTGSYMNLESPVQNYGFTPNGFPSSIYKFTWYNSLPLDHDWTVLQQFKPNYSPASQFTNILGVGGAYLKYDYMNRDGTTEYSMLTSGNGYKEISANWNYQWMGISYDSSLRKMSTIYSTDSQLSVPPSTSFVVVSETDISNSSELQVPIIHQTMFYNGNGSMDFAKVSIISSSVPEPSAVSLLAIGLGGLAIRRCRS